MLTVWAEVILNGGAARGYGYAVDAWSLGVILYACLTNQTPFDESESTPLPQRMRERRVDFEAVREAGVSDSCRWRESLAVNMQILTLVLLSRRGIPLSTADVRPEDPNDLQASSQAPVAGQWLYGRISSGSSSLFSTFQYGTRSVCAAVGDGRLVHRLAGIG